MIKNQSRILLFIPVYNCEKQIKRVLNQIKELKVQHFSEIIVVDNRSTDETAHVIKDFIEENREIPVNLLENDENYGLGGSHKVAFLYAIENNFEYVVTLHGDDQANIKDLVPYIETGEYEDYDCFLGARFMLGSKLQGYSFFRTFGNICFNMIFSLFLSKKLYDLGSGINLYKVEILKNKYWFNFPDDLTFNYVMTMALNFYNQKYKFFPVSWREDDQISNVKLASQACLVLKMLFSYCLNKDKFIHKDNRAKTVKEYLSSLMFSYNEKESSEK